MMIGTALLRRRARQHSKPSMPGSIRSISATSVGASANRSRPSSPLAASLTS